VRRTHAERVPWSRGGITLARDQLRWIAQEIDRTANERQRQVRYLVNELELALDAARSARVVTEWSAPGNRSVD